MMLLYDKVYFALGCVFCVIVVVGNIIFQKFINISVSGILSIEISVGVLLYPITFLISDLLTEFFGKERAKYVISVTVMASLFTMIILLISSSFHAVSWSTINDQEFDKVFGVYNIGTLASIIAIYVGQIIDVTLFSWIKQKTNHKHLWLRNNVSTMVAQFFDTVTVLSILYVFNLIPSEQIRDVFIGSFCFKIIAAIIDTPLCYLGHFIISKKLLSN